MRAYTTDADWLDPFEKSPSMADIGRAVVVRMDDGTERLGRLSVDYVFNGQDSIPMIEVSFGDGEDVGFFGCAKWRFALEYAGMTWGEAKAQFYGTERVLWDSPYKTRS